MPELSTPRFAALTTPLTRGDGVSDLYIIARNSNPLILSYPLFRNVPRISALLTYLAKCLVVCSHTPVWEHTHGSLRKEQSAEHSLRKLFRSAIVAKLRQSRTVLN
jgi:hypothetical protein